MFCGFFMRKTLFLELKKVAHLSEREQTSSVSLSALNRMRRHRRINPRDFSDTGGMTSSVQGPVWITGSGWFRPNEWSRVADWNQRHFPWMNILSWHRNTRCASPGPTGFVSKVNHQIAEQSKRMKNIPYTDSCFWAPFCSSPFCIFRVFEDSF